MRETRFIEQSKDKWAEVESAWQKGHPDPGQLREHFTIITDDLSYARTHYPNRSVRVYLNGIAQRLFARVYRGKGFSMARVRQFWLDEVPLMSYHARKPMLLAFLVVLGCALIGAFSSARNPAFPETIFGPAYVAETLENIEKGDPLGIYKSSSPGEMFVYIAVNNLRVALLMFTLGAFFALGTGVVLLINGIMLGTFMHFFYSRGLAWDFNLTVWMHGALEILAMVLEGAAGFTLGAGLLFPGTLSRGRSFQQAARRSVRMMLACVPIILLAAWIEGFVTRYTDLHPALRLGFIGLSALLMLYYFVIYPLRRFSGNREVQAPEDRPEPEKPFSLQLDEIPTSGSILLRTFDLLRFHLGFGIRLALIISGIMLFLATALYGEEFFLMLRTGELNRIQSGNPLEGFFASLGQSLSFLGHFFDSYHYPAMLGTNLLWFVLLMAFAASRVRRHFGVETAAWRFILSRSAGIMVPLALLWMIMFLQQNEWPAGMIVGLPPTMLWISINLWHSNGNPISGLRTLLTYVRSIKRIYTAAALFGVFLFLCFALLLSPTTLLLESLLRMNVQTPGSSTQQWLHWFLSLGFYLVANLLLTFYLFMSSLLSYVLREIYEATGMKARADGIRKQKRVYGLETE
jgi:uncharacterized membrane protein SpoIIM required for sporulation